MYPGQGGARQESAQKDLVGILILVGLGALMLTVAMWMHRGRSSPALPSLPASFDTFTSENNLFSCGYPSNWHLASNGVDSKKDRPFYMPQSQADVKMDIAMFTNGAADFNVNMDNMPSLFAQPSLNPQKLDPKKMFVQLDQSAAQDMVQSYKASSDRVFTCALGTADSVEFTGSVNAPGGESKIQGNVHGYCATIVSGEWHVAVNCLCSEADWPKVHPVFDQMIQSLTPGPAAQVSPSHSITPP